MYFLYKRILNFLDFFDHLVIVFYALLIKH